MNSRGLKFWIEGLALLVLFYIGVCLVLSFFQAKFIYHPHKDSLENLKKFAETQGAFPWEDENKNVIGWRVKPASGKCQYRALVLHGNAGMALDRLYYAEGLQALDHGKWEIYILEYPSYGARRGRPSEQTLLKAAEDALILLRKNDSRPVFVIGESLGGGVASLLAALHPKDVEGLFLITPFNNLVSVATLHFPLFPIKWILKDRYDAESALKKYHGPLAVMLAENDEVVSPILGHQLYERYQGEKHLWFMRNAGHNTLDFSPFARWWQEVFDFLIEGSYRKKN